jgi:ABC-type multidrug transport system ATPase subunit
MKGPSILVEGLALAHGRTRILRDLSLELSAGESLALIGPNGAGKTSLVSCLLGLVRPQRGRVLVGGRPPESLEVKRRLGYVPERCSLDRSLSARRSLRLHHALAGRPRAARDEEVATLLARTGLAAVAGRPARTYSKGQLQRLAFAVALVGAPDLLVLDEPFSGVDPAGLRGLRELIAGLRAEGATLVINSHRLDQVAELCDRVALLSRGRLEGVHDAGGSARALEGLVVEAAGEGA